MRVPEKSSNDISTAALTGGELGYNWLALPPR